MGYCKQNVQTMSLLTIQFFATKKNVNEGVKYGIFFRNTAQTQI